MPNDLFNPNSAAFNTPVDPVTKLELFKMLATTKTNVEIYVDQKILNSVSYPTTDTSKVAVICSNSPADQIFKTGKEMTCHFSIHNEIYFFTKKSTFTEAALIFSVPDVIYKIQRRNNFRVFIPKNMTQNLELAGLKQLKVHLVDLSLGGCKVSVQYPDVSLLSHLKAGSQIHLKMTFLNFENQILNCKIKFVRDNARTRSASVGLEFEKLKAEEIQLLQANIFKIDRLNRQSNLD